MTCICHLYIDLKNSLPIEELNHPMYTPLPGDVSTNNIKCESIEATINLRLQRGKKPATPRSWSLLLEHTQLEMPGDQLLVSY
jgi:hypothetical protein